jgi:WhiB family redox-sensing transcriptional regulator
VNGNHSGNHPKSHMGTTSGNHPNENPVTRGNHQREPLGTTTSAEWGVSPPFRGNHPGQDSDRPIFGDPAEIVTANFGTSDLIRTIVANLEPWRAEAACNGAPTAVFFPEQGGSSRLAFEYCGRCTVREQCLAEALADTELDHGIRGGLSANARKQRRKLDAARAKP